MSDKLSDSLPTTGQYLKATEFPETFSARLQIDKIEEEKMPGRDGEPESVLEVKPVVYFSNKEKGLVLNRTNTDTLIHLFGDSKKGMIGKEVILYRTVAMFQGKSVPALRLRSIEEQGNEDIPF